MAIFSRFLSQASTNGFRFIKNTTGKRWNCLRALSSSSDDVKINMQMNQQFSRLFSTVPVRCGTFSGDSFPLEKFVDIDELMHYTTVSPSPLSNDKLLEKCNCHENYMFLKMEARVRLAHIIMELHNLPKELQAEDKCHFTIEKYCTSYREVVQLGDKETTPEVFMQLLFSLKDRHQDTVNNIAEACENIKEKFDISVDDVNNQIFVSCNLFEFWRKL